MSVSIERCKNIPVAEHLQSCCCDCKAAHCCPVRDFGITLDPGAFILNSPPRDDGDHFDKSFWTMCVIFTALLIVQIRNASSTAHGPSVHMRMKSSAALH